MASRKYQVLRHFDESPQMPTGYPGMMVLSFFPPLWFRVMHKRIEQYRQGKGGEALG
jgi:alkane 1-monooxygenase